MKRSSLTLVAVMLLAGVGLLKPVTTAAATKQGITIAPPLLEQIIQPGETQKSFKITLTNNTNQIQELGLKTRDFGSLNETGGIILEGSNSYSQKYGLASWLSLEKDSVVLNPGESGSVQVTIDNRDSLRPGGHYGSIIADINGQPSNSSSHVQINQELVSLVLANKVGGEHYDLKLKSVEQNGNWLRLPNSVRLHFQNPGNVHVIPRGIVRLKAPDGTVLAQAVINTDSVYILPEAFREVYVPLNTVKHHVQLPGIYHIEVDYRYEGLQKSATKNVAVRYIALKIYLLILVILIVAFWLFKKSRIGTKKSHK